MKLRPQYPASFPILLFAGFTLVALPLLGGMINASYMVKRIVAEAQEGVDLTLAVTRTGRQLVDGVSGLQRAAGQYYVLEDASLRRTFLDAHAAFRTALATLQRQPLDPPQLRQVADLARLEGTLFARLNVDRGRTGARFDSYIAAFDQLHAAAVAVESEGHQIIGRRLAGLGESADAARRALVWQALAMVPLSLFLTLLFSWLINRPVGQLVRVIRRLGEDDLTPFDPVEGPRDMARLGERLDWLRLRLIDLEQQQARFLRHVSHELKTPLAALREGVELMADGVVGELGPQHREITTIMRGNVRELQRRIEALIQFNRLSQGAEPISARDLALDAVFAVAAQRHDLSLNRKAIRLVPALDGFRVRGDPAKLERVFENLLGNAIRFSPRGGRIDVTAAMAGSEVAITLCDQGPGILAEDRAHIFDAFYQGRVQPPEALHGSGLGLAIAKEFVEQHGGRIALMDGAGWSTSHGGACFEVVLPAAGGNGAS